MVTKVPDALIAGPLLAAASASDITATRALTAADFGFDVVTINAAGVVAITVPTIAALALASTPGKLRALVFRVTGGGIPTFAGATASTTINGTAGPTTALPLGGAPVTNGYYVLVQQAVGGNAWTLQ